MTEKTILESRSPLLPPAVEMDSTEVLGEPPPQIVPGKKSWVAAAQSKQVLKKYEVEISVSEGK